MSRIAHTPMPEALAPASEELRAIRRTLNLKVTAMARLLGLTRATLYKLEAGTCAVRPGILTLARYLAAQAHTVPPALPWLPGETQPARLVPVPVPVPGPASQGIALTPGAQCSWASERCRPPCWRFQARLDALHHVTGEACQHHLDTLYTAVIDHLRQWDTRKTRQKRGTPAEALAADHAEKGGRERPPAAPW